MTESGKAKSGKAKQQARRTARLGAALRENLKRRKEQARGRTAEETPGEGPAPDDDDAAPAPDFRRNPSRE